MTSDLKTLKTTHFFPKIHPNFPGNYKISHPQSSQKWSLNELDLRPWKYFQLFALTRWIFVASL